MSNKLNLCETCIYEFGSCEGEGIELVKDSLRNGDDIHRVTTCNTHTPSEPEPVAIEASPEPQIEVLEPLPDGELCSACKEALKVTKVNRRLRALICDNYRCDLYRRPIRTYSISKPVVTHIHQYKGKDNHCIISYCKHIRIRRNRKLQIVP